MALDVSLIFSNAWKNMWRSSKVLYIGLLLAYAIPMLIANFLFIPLTSAFLRIPRHADPDLTLQTLLSALHANVVYIIIGGIISILAALLFASIALLAFSAKKKQTVGSLLREAVFGAGRLLSVDVCLILILIPAFVIFIIPGIIFCVYFTFARVEAVVGKRKWFSALGASMQLVRRRWWLTLGLLILLALVLIVVSWPINFIFSTIPTSLMLTQGSVAPLYIAAPFLLVSKTLIGLYGISWLYELYKQYAAS